MQPTLFFCYGTLRSGQTNHHVLRDSKCLGKATTLDKYSLFVDGLPYCKKNPALTPIVGEVYEVLTPVFNSIDFLEGHPHFYQREEVPVLIDGKKMETAWIYFYNHTVKGTWVKNGDFVSPILHDAKADPLFRYIFTLTSPKIEDRFEIIAKNDDEFVHSYWDGSFSFKSFSSIFEFMKAMSQGGRGSEYHEKARFDSPQNWVQDLCSFGFLEKVPMAPS